MSPGDADRPRAAREPHVPETLRAELEAELSAARRGSGRARAAAVALSPGALDARIEATVFALLAHRDGRSICPSDVARVVGGDSWRDEMDRVRQVVYDLADRGRVAVTQKGEPVETAPPPRGPIRIVSAGHPGRRGTTSETSGARARRGGG